MPDIRIYPAVGTCENWCGERSEVVKDDALSQTADLEKTYDEEVRLDCMNAPGCAAARFTRSGRAMIAALNEQDSLVIEAIE